MTTRTGELSRPFELGRLLPAASWDDFLPHVARISANFGIDYTRERTPDHLKIQELYKLLRRDNWTAEEVARAADSFLRRCKFATWTFADFLEDNRSRLRVYPYSWYCDQAPADRDRIGAYRLEGISRPVYGWIEEIGDKLERLDTQPRPIDRLELPPPGSPAPEGAEEEIELRRRDLVVLELMEKEAVLADLRGQFRDLQLALEAALDRIVTLEADLELERDRNRDARLETIRHRTNPTNGDTNEEPERTNDGDPGAGPSPGGDGSIPRLPAGSDDEGEGGAGLLEEAGDPGGGGPSRLD